MARNAGGTYSAPVGQPVVAGTTITAATHNALVADLGTEITDSLSRSGKGPMLAVLKNVDGAVGAPAITFDSEATSGVYRAGAGDVRFGILGALVAKLTASGWFVDLVQAVTAATISVKGAVADGAAAVGVVLDNTIALANAGAKLVSIRNAGVEKAYITKDGAYVCSVSEDASSLITSGANWTNDTGSTYLRRSVGTVFGQATFVAGAGAAWTSVCTLPVGYRPPVQIEFVGRVRDNSAAKDYLAIVYVANTGVISVSGYDDGASIAAAPFVIGADDIVRCSFSFGL